MAQIHAFIYGVAPDGAVRRITVSREGGATNMTLEPLHGWAIAARIRQLSNDVLLVQQGSLYPALQRLEKRGWLSAAWGVSGNNRKARFYSLTRSGRRALEREVGQWRALSAAIDQLIAPAPAGT